MKKLFFFIVLGVIATTTNAQDIKLTLVGLNGSSQEVTMNIMSANFTTIQSNSNSRGGGGSSQVYVIEKLQDGNTSGITEAIGKGRVLKVAALSVPLANGGTSVTKFEMVYLSDYSSTMVSGQDPTEQFHLHYKNKQTSN